MSTYKEFVGNQGEEAVRDVLRELQGTVISGFIRSKNIQYFGKNFQIDFVLFVPKIGLVVIEVKNWKGTIKATSKEKWIQEFTGVQNEYNNASQQVLRTAGMLLQILEKGKMNKYPIRPLVVFAHDDVKVLKATNPLLEPQTEIIRKSMIKDWIIENSHHAINYEFTREDFDKVKNIIAEYTAEYKPS